MKILVIGAGGMLGHKLAARIARDGSLGGRAVERMTLVDLAAPEVPKGAAFPILPGAVDIAGAGVADTLLKERPDVVFHLAAIVSGEAEADFDLGYRVNLAATQALLEAIRAAHGRDGYRPRVVYASSLAVFGAPFPAVIPDDFHLTPLTSYGTQKAIGELLLSDYDRRGFLEGIALRLPTLVIRPGRPNRAVSGFFSNILREPLKGQEAVLPVDEDVRHWFASPRAAVGFCLHAATLDLAPLGPARGLTMPGLSATVGDEIAALRAVAGEKAVRLIRREPDPLVARVVAGWPGAFDAARARALGFTADTDFEAIIRAHLEDEG